MKNDQIKTGGVCDFPDLQDKAVIPWSLIGRPHDAASMQHVAISGHPFTVGRHAENCLSIANSTVSGCHAEIIQVEDGLFIRDLESTNGTLLNGRRLQGIAGLCDGDILHFGNAMYTLKERDDETGSETVATDAAEVALGQIQFDKLINTPAVRPDFQPIVRLSDMEVVAYEALSRSQLIGLETPDKMFRVAAQRTAAARLSEVCRFEALRVGTLLGEDKQYYLNTHPCEMGTSQLFRSLEDLRKHHPSLPVVLEVHESGVTSTAYLRELQSAIRELDISLAYDDFGAGQTRLLELAEVPPEVLKFDIKIVQGLPGASSTHRATVQSLVKIARDLNVVPLAEGIETQEEAEACREIGFELGQGYLFGRPERVTHWIPKPDAV